MPSKPTLKKRSKPLKEMNIKGFVDIFVKPSLPYYAVYVHLTHKYIPGLKATESLILLQPQLKAQNLIM